MSNNQDLLHRYLFSDLHVRGEIVQLDHSFASILQKQDYPLAIKKLLGELMAATSLLTATLKFKGEIAVQIQSEGPVKYAVINGNDRQELRGVARWEGDVPTEFGQMFKKGVMAITITPEQGERYQGIVALDKPSLAECIQAYFEQSEQLSTQVVLHTQVEENEHRAAGMLLQVLPVADNASEDFQHLSALTESVQAKELFELDAHEVLYRLYHQEKVEVFEPLKVSFKCTCSKERSAKALESVDKSELLNIVAADGAVTMNCQFCHAEYRFDAIDVEAIHAGSFPVSNALS